MCLGAFGWQGTVVANQQTVFILGENLDDTTDNETCFLGLLPALLTVPVFPEPCLRENLY